MCLTRLACLSEIMTLFVCKSNIITILREFVKHNVQTNGLLASRGHQDWFCAYVLLFIHG